MRFVKAAKRRLRFWWQSLTGVMSSWSLVSKVVLIGVGISVLQSNLYGLSACRFNIRRRKFVLSKPLAIYCFVVGFLFGFYYVQLIWTEYKSGQLAKLDIIKTYCYVNAVAVLLNYVTQWAMMHPILNYLNDVPLFSTINYFDVSFLAVRRFVIFGAVKMFGFPFMLQLATWIYQQHKQPELSWMHSSITMIPILLGNHLNNCFFGSILVAHCLFIQINNVLRKMLAEVNRLQTPLGMFLHKPYYRMQRFCDLADQLDELAKIYTQIAHFSRAYLVLNSFCLVMSLGINLFITTLGFFMQYQAIADYTFIEEAYDVTKALSHLVFLLVPFLEIILVARVSQDELIQAKETGNLLQRMSMEHADVRFKAVVDAFWLQVCTINLKLIPMGLLELDGSTVNKLYSTVTTFLLFLIQNDLNFRFSIK
ncbi:putative gustatory receptor 97a [Drosophila albomicans]|uniref:Gustatory receptor n=1 Tax=Drosophila albomicans TaxID=7291 RepID=A0A9C6T0U6_DROAB|nr:putative gustatory receptor 97a [Drosophila albomicans]